LSSRSISSDAQKRGVAGEYAQFDAEAGWGSGFAGGLLADAFEALLAALYLDRGLPAARAFLLRLFEVGFFGGVFCSPF
jgi:dsRNA-specific ribonuclease